ncbi:glycosyltransferase family 2 protein [Frankia sp. Cpl3]|nr:glycosyltransferase family 2 protein [Frankia sp. Cpl3]
MTVEVSILVVSYNTADLTVRCLESAVATSIGVSTEIIVVDNASTDGSAAVIRDRFPGVDLVEQDVNLGFGRAVNLAAFRAKGEYLLLLNPDAVVLDNAVAEILDFARRRPNGGVYGGRTLRPDGTVDPSSCWGAPSLWSFACFGLGLSTLFRRSRLFDPESLGRWPRDTVREVGVVTGCLLLVRRDLFERLGGFDPRFFMYGEDTDLSMRVRSAGYRPVVTPAAAIVHHVGASSSGWANKHVLVLRGKTTLVRKHWSGWRRQFCLAMIILGVTVRALLDLIAERRGPTSRRSDWRAVWKRRRDWWSGYPEYVPLPTGLEHHGPGSRV